MKKIELSQNKYTLVDDEDFDYLNQYKWCADKGRNTNYARRNDYKLKKAVLMHRVIMNPPNNMQIDHINHNGLDNRKENLRICTRSQNQGNSKIRKNNKSGVKGICWDKRDKNWKARMKINGKRKSLGYFTDIDDAKKAYEKAAKEHFGEFYFDGNLKEENLSNV